MPTCSTTKTTALDKGTRTRNIRTALINSQVIHPWSMVEFLCNRSHRETINTDKFPKEYTDPQVDNDTICSRFMTNYLFKDCYLVIRDLKYSTDDFLWKMRLGSVFSDMDVEPTLVTSTLYITKFIEGAEDLIVEDDKSLQWSIQNGLKVNHDFNPETRKKQRSYDHIPDHMLEQMQEHPISNILLERFLNAMK